MSFLYLDLFLAGAAGFLSAIIMTLIEYPFWRAWGIQGVSEWQVNWVMVSALSKKWKTMKNPLISWTIASHISHGVVAGIAFRLLLPFVIPFLRMANASLLLDGTIFGIALWFLFTFLLRRVYEKSGQVQITDRGLLIGLLSDASFGFFLGLFVTIF